MVRSTVGLDLVHHMKVTEPEYFHSMVKMHLSFLLDLHTDECDCSFLYDKQEKESKVKKAFTPMKKKSTKGVMDGVPLTQEGVCQVYQIVEYLGRSHNITAEGLFRKHGNLKKQQALKERLNKGIPLNLDDDEFTVHECAAVLKNFLANLPEPLLTDAYFRAHCQVPLLCRENMNEEDRKAGFDRQVSCLQLLFQLIPEVNYTLLKDLLFFLHSVTDKEEYNKMSAGNLGTIFSTHLMCPRKMPPETLQSNHMHLSKAVAFMIENCSLLFTVPEQLLLDLENHLERRAHKAATPKVKTRKLNVGSIAVGGSTPKPESPVVNTVFSFVDREASKSNANATDQALAALYAHVQSMPESAQKRKLVTKLNQANGKGTPDVATSGSVRTVGRRQRRKSGDGIMNLLTPRRKRPAATGSYTFRQPELASQDQPTTTFRRQTSLQAPQGAEPVKLLSPSQSSPALLSPRQTSDYRGRLRFPSPVGETPASQASEVCAVDEVDTPGKESEADPTESRTCTGDHEGSFTGPPPLPPRTPAPRHTPPRNFKESPLTAARSGLPESAMTPRSRAPVIICSSSQLDKWNRLVHRSPSLPGNYYGADPDQEGDEDLESDLYFAELDDCEDSEAEEETDEVYTADERAKDSCRSRSLSAEFKEYLSKQGLEVPSDTSSAEDSLLDEGEASYSRDVRRLLRQGEKLSTSMQAVLDGDEPDLEVGEEVFEDTHQPPPRKSPRLSSSGRPSNRPSSQSSSCSRGSSTSTIKAVDTSIQDISCSDENEDPNAGGRRGRKRRSITELGAIAHFPPSSKGNIFFETDL